jgi:hypothetical protein
VLEFGTAHAPPHTGAVAELAVLFGEPGQVRQHLLRNRSKLQLWRYPSFQVTRPRGRLLTLDFQIWSPKVEVMIKLADPFDIDLVRLGQDCAFYVE